MILVILDTNVLVSGMFSRLQRGKPAQILRMVIDGYCTMVYSPEIYEEYAEVLKRPKFAFLPEDVAFILGVVRNLGMRERVLPGLTGQPCCSDEDDQKFYDLALSTDAVLVTGNIKHFPADIRVATPAEYLPGALCGDNEKPRSISEHGEGVLIE